MRQSKQSRQTEHEDDEDDYDEEGVKRNQLLQQNAILMLSGPISNHHLGITQELLAYHYREDFNSPITLLINSPGGSCEIGWAIVDVMNFIRLPVNTVVLGMAASMAADIFANGDHRTMGEHSTLMVHSHSSMVGGDYTKLISTMKGETIEYNRRLQHYITNSKYTTKQQIEDIFFKHGDLYLTPQETLDHGLADAISQSNSRGKRIKQPAIGSQLLEEPLRDFARDRSPSRPVTQAVTGFRKRLS
jgi:ATP-dependent Clp protease protease subunit